MRHPPGFHRPSTTIAIATYPRPAVIRSEKVPTCASTRLAPARPATRPAKHRGPESDRETRRPAARAAERPRRSRGARAPSECGRAPTRRAVRADAT